MSIQRASQSDHQTGGCTSQLRRRLGLGVLALTLIATAAVAGDPTQTDSEWVPVVPGVSSMESGADDTAFPTGFGTQDWDVATISWMRFFPWTSTDGYGGGGGTIARSAAGTDRRLFAEITPGDVPNGALIEQICFYLNDTNASANISLLLIRFHLDSGTGTGYSALADFVGATNGSPGETAVCDFVHFPVLRRFDINGDGENEVVAWALLFWPGTSDSTHAIRMARVRWRRQVSPAPATATFNDVPTDHQFFQHIEALVASGITAGTGGGNYSPDAPLTRGQMAVFLAKALGLHWPAF